MSQDELEIGALSKKERRKFFKEVQAKESKKERRKGLVLKIFLTAFVVGVITLLGYFIFTARPTTTTGQDSIGNLKIGDSAPEVSLPSTSGGTVSLIDFSDKNVLLYFNEGVMCAPCWKQIGTMEQKIDQFSKLNTQVLAIGVDSAKDWEPILKAEKITTIPVLIDADRSVSGAYGVLNTASQMHSDRPGHTFILVDQERKIRWIGDYPTMRITDEEVLNLIKQALAKEI